MELHDYQHELLERVRQELRAGKKSVLIQLPTGAGKTVCTASMLGNASKRGVRSAFGVHRRELIKQSIDTFNFVGIKHGIISAGWHPNRRYPVQIASIPTWMRRTRRVGNFDLIVWDECHHLRSASWSRLHADYPDAVHIGLTATPERLDGKGMGTHFDTMVCGPSTAELIRRGYLSPFRLFSVPSVITDGLHKNMGDFAKGELLERMNASTVTGDAIAHYKRHAPGRRAVLFEASVERSERAAEAFRQAGIPAVHVDGNSTDEDRDRAVRDFAAGDVRVLCNVDLFGEGFDLPAMEAVILCRPTHSLALFLQQCGRGLRIAPGKTDCIILDHAGNFNRHGSPDAERRWTLEGRVGIGGGNGEATVTNRVCTFCFATSPPTYSKCRSCGQIFPVKSRAIEEVEGELTEVQMTPEVQARFEEYEEGIRQFLDDRLPEFDALVQEARRRKIRNPHGWAMHVIEGREKQQRRQTA